jgi:ribosomal protein L14
MYLKIFLSNCVLQKNSFTIPSDTSGVLLAKVIQTRRCGFRKHAKTGKFTRTVNKVVKPKIAHRRKKRTRSLVIRSSHRFIRPDGMCYKFEKNALTLLKRRMNTVGKEVIGPSCLSLKIKKFRNSVVSLF